MGVQDLNKIVKDFPKAKSKQDYQHVIIDYSNLIIVLLMRHLSIKNGTLPRTNEIVFKHWSVRGEGLIVCDIHDQIERLTNAVVRDTASIIDKLKYDSLEEIIFVSDPTGKYDYRYVYNSKTKMSCVNNELFNRWLDINGYDFDDECDITFNSKEKEKELRNATRAKQKLAPIEITRTSNQKSIIIDDYSRFNDFDSILAEFEGLNDEHHLDDVDIAEANDKNENENESILNSNEIAELKRICVILYHSSYFNNKNNVLAIAPIIKSETVKTYSEREDIKFICSRTEADVFIKAYYSKYIKDEPTLIISNDTDYDILFGELSEVDVALVSPFSPRNAVNPYSYWTTLFETEDTKLLRQLLARVSALFGNDYTCHQRAIVCDENTIELVPRLFNIGGSVNDRIEVRSTTSIYKLFTKARIAYARTSKEEQPANLAYFAHVDSAICNDSLYLNGYYETLLIYCNYNQYVKYDILIPITDDERNEIERKMANTTVDYTALFFDDCIGKF